MGTDKSVSLSKAVLEMKFMKKTKERIERAAAEAAAVAEVAGAHGLYASEITAEMKRGICCSTEPSMATILDLIDGRRSYGGMNPEIELLTRMAENPEMEISPPDEVEVTDRQMAEYLDPFADSKNRKFAKLRPSKRKRQKPAGKQQREGEQKDFRNKAHKRRKRFHERKNNNSQAVPNKKPKFADRN